MYRLIGLLLVLLSLPSFAGSDERHELRIEVAGFEADGGQLGINLFRSDDEMFEHPYRVTYANISDHHAVVTLRGLPLGDYAVVVYHDRNSNGELDHHWLGFPNEPIGYSSDYRFGLFSGMPTFNKLKFHYQHDVQQLAIQIED